MDQSVEGHVKPDARRARGDDTVPLTVLSGPHEANARSEDRGSAEASQPVAVGSIPAQPPGFLPRPALLAALDQADTRTLVVHSAAGGRGVGATQLAAAYARAKLRAGWRLVAWVNGADPDVLMAGLASVADAIGLADHDPGIREAAATAMRQWLETEGDRCLLVVDDVSDPRALNELIPTCGTARVLITSTSASAPDLGRAVPVDVFGAPEALALLAERTGLDEEAGAAAVAAVLGHLPLSLALASPVIAELPTGFAGYLDRLQATSTSMAPAGGDGRPYPPGLAGTVLLSWAAVRAEDRTGVGVRVLDLMAVLSSAGVSRDLLYVAGRVGVLASGRRRVTSDSLDSLVEWLEGRSLLTASLDGHTVMMHPLVAHVIRGEVERRRELTVVCDVAASVLDAYARALVGSADRWAVREISAHMTALLAASAALASEADDEPAELLRRRLRLTACCYLLELGDSTPRAIALGEPLTRDLERLLGADHPETLRARNSLATAYLSAGRAAEAIGLLEPTLAMRRRILGPDDPDTLTSRDHLASAYRNAGRTSEAIWLYLLNLETQSRLLGADHPSTLNSSGDLAAAYQEMGRAGEAIPFLERTLAGRECALGPDHPDTQTSRKNLARAYRDMGRGHEASSLPGRSSAGRKPGLPAGPSPRPAGLRRPPAESARRIPSAGLRRPPLDAARRPSPHGLARLTTSVPDHPDRPAASIPPDQSGDFPPDQDIVAAMTRQDPVGLAMAYEKYAASLYHYCHWMLRDPAPAAEALTDAFIVATARLRDLSEPAKLRPWLYALARNECRRRTRTRPRSASRAGQTEPAGQQPEADSPVSDSTVQFSAVGGPGEASSPVSDSTVQFRAVGGPGEAFSPVSDSTVQFSAVGGLAEAFSPVSESTVQFLAVGRTAAATSPTPGSAVPFRALGRPAGAAREPLGTRPATVASLPTDMTAPLPIIDARPAQMADMSSASAEAALRTLLRSILAGLTPREREVIELSFTHGLNDDDLAIAFDVSWSRAHTLAGRVRGRVKESLSALHIALTRRDSCAALGELLAGWDGQLTEQTSKAVSRHIKGCPACEKHGLGELRLSAFGRLLPPAPLPAGLRQHVLERGTSRTAEAASYRRRVLRRADSSWLTGLSLAIRKLSWASIRARPGMAITAVVVAICVASAIAVSLLIIAGHQPA